MTCTGIGTGNLISQSVVLWHEFLTLPRWDILYTIFTDIENLLASSFISLPKFSRKARFPSQGCDCKIFHNQFIYVKKHVHQFHQILSKHISETRGLRPGSVQSSSQTLLMPLLTPRRLTRATATARRRRTDFEIEVPKF